MLRLPTVAVHAACLLLPVAACGVDAADTPNRWEQLVEVMPAATGDAAAASADPAAFRVPGGFTVERLFVVPKEELGSWVCLAPDGKGRIFASDQRDKGLVRITPGAADGSRPTVVERLPAAVSAAQGLLWAFDALYVVQNDPTGSGLFRLTDRDGDGLPEHVEKLRDLPGAGEHGPLSWLACFFKSPLGVDEQALERAGGRAEAGGR